MAPKTNDQEDPTFAKIESACSDLKALIRASEKMEETRFDPLEGTEALSTASRTRRVIPLHSLAMSAKALDTRINRAISPALALLDSFKLCDSLQHNLHDLSSKLSAEKTPQKRLKKLLDYVDCVDKLNEAIDSVCQEGEPVIQRLQEVVELMGRSTKAADQYGTQRLREPLVTLKALYETEVDAMPTRFEGLLDQALLLVQGEFETLLLQIRHQSLGDPPRQQGDSDTQRFAVGCDLGSELEVEVLRQISETLAANDCLDICFDIYIKVRYKRAAKALMRLNPDYLREEIDDMDWESLEKAITFWIQHLEIAVKKVLFSEKKLCGGVMGEVMDGLVWPECFVKISDKIMGVFFRFGEGVARGSKEPHKLFKLLDMFESLEKLKPKFFAIFDDEAGVHICTRFRELEKLIIDASSKVFWEFGRQIEENVDGSPPPQDGSVPKLLRYAINYLKYLATENYRTAMAKVLRSEQTWKSRISSKPETDENLLKDALSIVMDALQRNIESKSSRYMDKILIHVFAMNTYWYIYIRTKNTELGELLGEQYMKTKYKVVAEESAYMYQKQAWGVLVKILDVDEVQKQGEDTIRGLLTEKMETFLKCLDDMSRRHRGGYCSIPDIDLREQIREATLKLVVPAYREFLESYSGVLRRKQYPGAERLQGLVGQAFDGDDDVKLKHRIMGGRSSASPEGEMKDFRGSRSDTNGNV